MRVRSDGEWRTKAVVEGQSQSPRSYIIKIEAGKHLRRNRQNLLQTKEKAPDDTQMTIPEPIQSTEIQAPVTTATLEQVQPQNVASLMRTRSGRVINKPLKYRY